MTQASTPEGGHLAATLPPTASATAPAATPAPMKTFTQAEVEALVITASAAAATQERERLCAIQSHPNASAQPGIVKLCIDTGMSADQAGSMLSAATTAAPAAAANPFTAAMAATPNPQVSGIEGPASTTALDPAARANAMAASILGNYRARAKA